MHYALRMSWSTVSGQNSYVFYSTLLLFNVIDIILLQIIVSLYSHLHNQIVNCSNNRATGLFRTLWRRSYPSFFCISCSWCMWSIRLSIVLILRFCLKIRKVCSRVDAPPSVVNSVSSPSMSFCVATLPPSDSSMPLAYSKQLTGCSQAWVTSLLILCSGNLLMKRYYSEECVRCQRPILLSSWCWL